MGVVRVAQGRQPHLWCKKQADAPYDPEEPWEGDVVPGVEGKLVMAVLSSQKGWPYGLFGVNKKQKKGAESLTGYNAVCDAYIRRSNLRVWNIVKKGLDKWFVSRLSEYPSNFTVIGTPGIGKSFATGSLLLYQVLHYKSENLKVVAYFMKERAYIFHREDRRVVFYEEQTVALRRVNEMVRKGVEGYIIYDMCGGHNSIHSLPDEWGAVLLTSPKSSNYERWSADRLGETLPIYVDCYGYAEFKAVLIWERKKLGSDRLRLRKRPSTILEDWEVLRNRIYKVGPVPRYVLRSDGVFNARVRVMCGAVKTLNYDDLGNFMRRLRNEKEWPGDNTTHKIVMLVRTLGDEGDACRNQIVSSHIRTQLNIIVIQHFCNTRVSYSALCTAAEHGAHALEEAGILAFLIRSVSDVMVRHLKYLPREGETERSCTSVLARVYASGGRVPSRRGGFDDGDQDLSLQPDKLYSSTSVNFPVVDGFFLVDAVGEGVSFTEGAAAPTQTIVLIQVTKARDHHTTTSKVEAFRKRMARSFTNWTEMESRLSYEIIYVQHADSTTLTGRQRCARSGVANDAGNEEF
ncbi:unnamed protein product [Trypanosoma congolense IL3000]|uniref:WGS project CAEQ00000000 data, annotated contig 2243 n=1 Tax=Trypanosoma congolense (strain IL3000) TaxID=1068625 RepID=F9WCK6_TRYCI|nr:unnamed protein product [Trypanosoma congolense IL3000]